MRSSKWRGAPTTGVALRAPLSTTSHIPIRNIRGNQNTKIGIATSSRIKDLFVNGQVRAMFPNMRTSNVLDYANTRAILSRLAQIGAFKALSREHPGLAPDSVVPSACTSNNVCGSILPTVGDGALHHLRPSNALSTSRKWPRDNIHRRTFGACSQQQISER